VFPVVSSLPGFSLFWAMSDSSPDPLVAKSHLYQEFLAERDEILRHKWLKSEQARRDIGFDAALIDWMLHHRRDWRRQRRENLRQGSSEALPE